MWINLVDFASSFSNLQESFKSRQWSRSDQILAVAGGGRRGAKEFPDCFAYANGEVCATKIVDTDAEKEGEASTF